MTEPALSHPTPAWLAALLLAAAAGACGPATDNPEPQVPQRDAGTVERVSREPGGDPDSGSWPGWGGPGGDFKVSDAGLSASWPETGPEVLWTRDLGPGYSGVAVDGGSIFTLYRDGVDEVAVALDGRDGTTLWESRYAAPPREANVVQFGEGPNATPLVAGGRVITLGYTGLLRALDPATGAPLWGHDLVEEFGGEVLDFGTSASPVAWRDMVLVLVGGARQAVLALRLDNGEVAWKSEPGTVSYATPTIIRVDGQPQLLYFGADELVALNPDSGRRLWRYPVANQYRNHCTAPQWGDDGLLWVVTQLDGGARALRLTATAAGTEVEEVWFSNEVSVHFWNTQRLDGRVYAASGGQGSILTASDVATGEILWRLRGYPRASLLQVGDRTLLLDEEGGLTLARLVDDGLEVLATARVGEGRFWTPPALAGRTLLVRDEAGTLRALRLG